jgi:hypothetical protein
VKPDHNFLNPRSQLSGLFHVIFESLFFYMKSILVIIAVLFCISACNTNKKPKKEEGSKTGVEKLMQEIDDIHIAGMSKMAELTRLNQQTKKLIDSLAALPAKPPVAGFKTKLDSLSADLSQAEANMEQWMNDFYNNPDTLAGNESLRMQYLEAQKTKAGEVRDAITRNIQKADSLLKTRF